MYHTKIIFYFVMLLAVSGTTFLSLNSCQHDPFITDKPVDSIPPPLEPCDSTKVYFQNDIMPYVNSTCAVPGCHDEATPAAGIDLTSYTAIMNSKVLGNPIVIPGDAFNSKFCRVLYALDLIPMPPLYNLAMPNNIKQKIVKWVEQGAENTACDAQCDTSSFKYSKDIAPLMRKYCSGCHFGDYASKEVYTTTYVKVKGLVDSNNILYKTISGNPAFIRMPFGNVVMAPCDIIKVRKWIESGAPNN